MATKDELLSNAAVLLASVVDGSAATMTGFKASVAAWIAAYAETTPKTKVTVGTGAWERDIALLGLTRITEIKGEYALVTMDPKGVIRAWETTYRDRKVAVGQATRIQNASGEACTRVYVVTRFNQKAVVYLDTNTLLWHGDIPEAA